MRASLRILSALCVANGLASPLLRGASARAKGEPGVDKPHGLLAAATFSWLDPMLHLGATRPLQLPDLPPLDAPGLPTRAAADGFEEQWARLSASPTPTALNVSEVAVALWRCHGGRFAWAGGLKLCCDLCQIASPLLLKRTISLLESGAGLRRGAGAVTGLLGLTALQAFALRHYFASVFKTGLAMRAALVGATYRKLLLLSPAARLRASSGEITNLMGSDAQRIADLTPYLHALWFAPLQVIAALAILGRELGWAVLPGLAVIGAMLRLNKSIAAATYRVQKQLQLARDERARLTRELLGGIKAIKLNAWEAPFGGRIERARDAELGLMRRLVKLRSLLSALFTCTPTLVAVVMLAASTYAYRTPLTLKTAMTVLATVNLLRSPLVFLPLVLQSLQEASLSFGRMASFLRLPESTPLPGNDLAEVGVAFHAATLRWPSAAASGSGDGSGGDASGGDFSGGDASGGDGGGGGGGFALRDVSLSATGGQLVGVAGAVGSGKSSLLAALLGDMPCSRGSVQLRGAIAYAAQTPFLLSATVRDNILFGKPYDADRFARVVEACQLLPDLDSLPFGELTLLGDKGVALSGGQRARVTLARAVYSDAQVVLLDDPLAACDPTVAQRLMQRVIGPRGLLKDKLRVFVSSSLEPFAEADAIHVLAAGGVAESGTFTELEAAGGEFARQLALSREQRSGMQAAEEGGEGAAAVEAAAHEAAHEAEAPSPPHVLSVGDAEKACTASEAAACEVVTHAEPPGGEAEAAGRPSGGEGDGGGGGAAAGAGGEGKEEEARVTGAVRQETLARWLAAAGGRRVVLFALLPLVAAELVSTGSSWWLTRWAAAPATAQLPYLLGFAGWAVASAVLVVVRSRMMLSLGLLAGEVIHSDLLTRVLAAPLSFFDVTPRGRVLSRFSREMLTVDVSLPSALQTYLSTLASVGSTALVVLAASPLFGAFLLPLAFAYSAVQAFYSASSRELKRVEAATRSPFLSHVATSLDGLATIRAFDARRRFGSECERTLDANLRASLASALVNCWLGLRLELLGATISAAAAALAFARNSASASASSAIAAGLRGAGGVGTAALGVTLALQVTQTLNWSVRQATELESHLISVERLQAYTSLEPEPGWVPPNAAAATSAPPLRRVAPTLTGAGDGGEGGGEGGGGGAARFPAAAAYLPEGGRGSGLVLRDLSLRYRDGLPLVLDGVSAEVRPGEKVGVVGRTGSGKSSLVAAVMRLVAPPLRSGAVEMDGVDVSKTPLLEHREGVAVIPQEPTLFSGSVRDNLDPKGAWSDEALWEALRRVQMAHAVPSLHSPVAEDGANFSAGQRQLLCIARALLSRCSLVLLDEATSSVDAETDALIQRTVRSAFGHATVLTIAHRLSSVLDADKIMVLEAGRLVEFGSPQELMAKSGGAFRQLVVSGASS